MPVPHADMHGKGQAAGVEPGLERRAWACVKAVRGETPPKSS